MTSGMGTIFSYLNRTAQTGLSIWAQRPAGTALYLGTSSFISTGASTVVSETERWEIPGASGASQVPVGQWTHIAITRSGFNMTLFVNGILIGGKQVGDREPTSETMAVWGQEETATVTNRFHGQIADFRVTKRCRYPFVPPSSPFPG
jgi:hypothetical protein